MPLTPKLKYALASKPVLWSNNGYRGPSDPKVQGGFVKTYGYGGEEWNGDIGRQWKGNRYFSSETAANLDAFAEHGHLGLIMTAMRGDVQYVVGVACDVSLVTDHEATKLAKVFKLGAVGSELWSRPAIKGKFASEKEFKEHWGTGLHTIHWTCPASLFHWFDQPLALPKYPLRSDKMVLAKMHGSFQALRPEDGIKLLGQALDDDHPIMQWLITKEFDPQFLSSRDREAGPPLTAKERAQIASAAAAKKPYTRYLAERVITVNAEHGVLESEFHEYLTKIGATGISRNVAGIDISFRHPTAGDVIAELKPASRGETRFALRIAIGQVLEYRHFIKSHAHPMIVLGSKPLPKEVEFVTALGISCAWKAGQSFGLEWADEPKA
jgi:hypothetical protein